MKDQLRNVFLTVGLGTLIFVPMLIIDNGLNDSMKSVLIWLGASILYGMSFSILELKTIFRIPLHFAACFAITCAVRIGHTYAPTMDLDNDPRVFASFMKCAVEKKDIVMLSDGSAKRPFCYIADAIAAFVILLIKGKPGEAYNMTNTDAFVSIGELAEIIASIEPEANLKVIRKQREKDDNYLENSLNHANCPGNSKLKKLGWECEYDIRKGFSQVLEYYSMPKYS